MVNRSIMSRNHLLLFLALFATQSESKTIFQNDAVVVKLGDGRANDGNANGTLIPVFAGLTLPHLKGYPSSCQSKEGNQCLQWGGVADFSLTTLNDGCVHVSWSANLSQLMDCIDMDGVRWYGGGETFYQLWPIDGLLPRPETAYITNDFLANIFEFYGGVLEPYWLSSNGVAILADEDIPLFVSINDKRSNSLCLRTAYHYPYKAENIGDPLKLSYKICKKENLTATHLHMINNYLGKPKGIPDERLFREPIWSTWAEYYQNVNQTLVLEYAKKVRDSGIKASQIEIDDNWETCYGELEFDTAKFPDPKAMVAELKNQGHHVTIWIHPFLEQTCPKFKMASDNQYLVKDMKWSLPGPSPWWGGRPAGVVDTTYPKAVAWWVERLRSLQRNYGIDSFKFDAGETRWLPDAGYFKYLPASQHPNGYSTKYAEVVSQLGKGIEVRVGRNTQHLPIFVRMLDKSSVWEYENGLKTLIPTLFQFSILGYPFVLPDMIGGNGYDGNKPSRELYIRWSQANAFMPAMQFSIAPWTYDDEVVEMTRKMVDLHASVSDYIIKLAKESVETGAPINRPLWWNDPHDETALTIDSEFLLGDRYLVTPVLDEGATKRDIYLPSGNWKSALTGVVHKGPQWLRDYEIKLDQLEYFTKSEE